jgi:DNA-binding LytR/AlgR family response regulator
MKVSIEEIEKEIEEEIIIRCHQVNNQVVELINSLKSSNKRILIGYDHDNIHRINIADVYYFESVDDKVFIYCKQKVFESKQKLYELEKICEHSKFFRASKSTILNIAKIAFITPSISGRFEASLDNGEKLVVSRQYVPVLKHMLDL